ncbi:MAG: DUF1249 domain-containing protein [Gammaproteobacteria bacterium]|nr:DUF1249 domain-containing protein [Gammaproteobacteria bacterium]
MYFPELKAPRTSNRLARLMELYESNYLLMRLLIPRLKDLDEDCYVSTQQGCVDLRLEILERCKYTTTLKLTYNFSRGSGKTSEPDLVIRIYHDARTAEAMSGLIHGKRHEQRRVRDLDEGWILNRFLYKWIKYCLLRGHRFSGLPDTAKLSPELAYS